MRLWLNEVAQVFCWQPRETLENQHVVVVFPTHGSHFAMTKRLWLRMMRGDI